MFPLLLFTLNLQAHESRPVYLEINETAPGRYTVLWRTPVLSGLRLPVALKLPDNVHDITPPIIQELSDSLLERRFIETGTGGLNGQRIELPGLQATITDVLARVRTLDGRDTTTIIHPSRPWLDISAPPGRLIIAAGFLLHGIQHILFGVDHLLFVLGLLLIVKDRWMLLKTVTAFTVAHSITLGLATFGFPAPPVIPLNAAIALSILFLGPRSCDPGAAKQVSPSSIRG